MGTPKKKSALAVAAAAIAAFGTKAKPAKPAPEPVKDDKRPFRGPCPKVRGGPKLSQVVRAAKERRAKNHRLTNAFLDSQKAKRGRWSEMAKSK